MSSLDTFENDQSESGILACWLSGRRRADVRAFEGVDVFTDCEIFILFNNFIIEKPYKA